MSNYYHSINLHKECNSMISCPIRIDLSAGWPDSDPYRSEFGGSVFSVAIDIRATAKFKDGNLITSLKGVPSNSGLGTSGALRAAYLAASNQSLIKNKLDLIKRVWKFENDIIGHRAGFQDQATAIFGGMNLWEFYSNGAIKRHEVAKEKALALEENLILVYTGQSHLSNNIHDMVFHPDHYEKNIKILDEMKSIARGMYSGFHRQDFFIEQMQNTWKLQKELSPAIETDIMKDLQKKLRGNYEACKATGAGAGGCLVFYTKNKSAFKMCLEALEDNLPKNVEVIDVKFDFEGIKIE